MNVFVYMFSSQAELIPRLCTASVCQCMIVMQEGEMCSQAVAFHLWSRAYRHTFQADVPVDLETKAKSQAHVRQVLKHSPESQPVDNTLQEEDVSSCQQKSYSALGSVRSLQDFWQHCSLSSYSVHE